MLRKKTAITATKKVATEVAADASANLHEFLEVQEEIARTLQRIEKKLDSSNHAHSNLFRNISDGMTRVLKNQGVFYTKFLLTRLNMMELSEGRKISVSRNEQVELENSKSTTPDNRIASLPQLSEVRLTAEKKVGALMRLGDGY